MSKCRSGSERPGDRTGDNPALSNLSLTRKSRSRLRTSGSFKISTMLLARSEPGTSSTFAESPGSMWDNKRAAVKTCPSNSRGEVQPPKKKKSEALYRFFSFQEPCTGDQIEHFAGRYPLSAGGGGSEVARSQAPPPCFAA